MIGRLVQQEEFGRLGRGKDGGEAYLDAVVSEDSQERCTCEREKDRA